MGVSPNTKQRLQGRWHPPGSLPRCLNRLPGACEPHKQPRANSRTRLWTRAHRSAGAWRGSGLLRPRGSPPVQTRRRTRQRPARAAAVGWRVPAPRPAGDGARLGGEARAEGGRCSRLGGGRFGGPRSGVGGAAGGAARGAALPRPRARVARPPAPARWCRRRRGRRRSNFVSARDLPDPGAASVQRQRAQGHGRAGLAAAPARPALRAGPSRHQSDD